MASARGDPMYHRIQVLVVDDDAAIREFLRMLLEEEGYTVFEAIDGITALDVLRSGPEGMVVITNHYMPGLDGPGLITALLADPQLAGRHALLYMTAAGPDFPPSFEQRLRQLHVPVLRKPFELDAFLSAVARAAGRLATAHEPDDARAHT